jgi:hypothetical protein
MTPSRLDLFFSFIFASLGVAAAVYTFTKAEYPTPFTYSLIHFSVMLFFGAAVGAYHKNASGGFWLGMFINFVFLVPYAVFLLITSWMHWWPYDYLG